MIIKELSIEEKAKAYDEAKMRMSAAYNSNRCTIGFMNEIFPELKESEGEKIRKSIIEFVKQNKSFHYLLGVSKEDAIAWLEKQAEQKPADKVEPKFKVGDIVKHKDNPYLTYILKRFTDDGDYEFHAIGKDGNEGCTHFAAVKCQDDWELVEQKPTDKVEPKFHKGDWIVHHGTENIYQVVAVIDNQYQLKYGDNYAIQNCADVDRCARLWDITKDAKDGDVIFTSSTASHETFIFKNIDERGNVKCYFAYDSEDGFREGKYHFIGSAINCKPATKEQYDTLMKAMADAGYTFDFDKKELKKIEQKPADMDNKFLRIRETKPNDISEFLDRLTTVEQEFLWEHIAKIRELDKEEL